MVELEKQNFNENKLRYQNEEKKLKELLGEDIKTFHVGSTAIPEILGKNIIDILIAVDEERVEVVSKKLEENNFFKSEKSATNIYKFFASKKEETKAGDVHIHLVVENTERCKEFLLLKNYLLKHPKIATEYSNHKKEILEVYGNDRSKYREEKSKYVSNLIDVAKKEEG